MTATRYKVIETALCIGDSVFDGEVVMVLASDYDRLEQERERLRAAPCDCGAPVGYVSGDKFQTEHEHLRECRVQRDAALKQVEALQEALAELLAVMPVLPAAAKQLIGMQVRYASAVIAARAALEAKP